MSSFRLLLPLLSLLVCINHSECYPSKGLQDRHDSAESLPDTLSARVLSSKRVLRRERGLGGDNQSNRNGATPNRRNERKGVNKVGRANKKGLGMNTNKNADTMKDTNPVIDMAPEEEAEAPEQWQMFDGELFWEFPQLGEKQEQVQEKQEQVQEKQEQVQEKQEQVQITRMPTIKPTNTPTKKPTNTPTEKPTEAPTLTPSKPPTSPPTRPDTRFPTWEPATRQTQEKQEKQEKQQAGEKLDGPGCHFQNPDASITSFEEGQSMGVFSTVSSCANNVPAAFPGYCVHSAPNQTVFPYCFFRDAFNQNICGRANDEIGILHPNRTLLHCHCHISVVPFGNSYDIKVNSNCEMIDLTTKAPATQEEQSAPPTDPPFTSPPLTPSPITFVPATAPPITPAPTTATPITAGPTKAPADPFVITRQPTTPPVASTLSPVNTYPTLNPESVLEDHLVITYQPGNLTTFQEGLWLSHGLSARVLARAGQRVPYVNSVHGAQSQETFHIWPDGAAIFNDNRSGNSGGWIYVSNSEMKNGGVGAVTFNAFGDVIHYRQILYGTKYNCNGGRTPWGTWITAEEDFDKAEGRLWQVDPYGVRQPEALTLGAEGGVWEAFAYDVRNQAQPRFFASEDDEKGCLRRWTPVTPKWDSDPWTMLHGPGVTEYLVLQPDSGGVSGTYFWTTDEKTARQNAKDFYPSSEGIEVLEDQLHLIVKKDYRLFTLNLDKMTYSSVSTRSGLFDGEPDQVKAILQDDGSTRVYFSEDWGNVAGIHARDEFGGIFTILEGPQYAPETTGISFSPDGKRMYFTFQENGIMFEVTRDDGFSFHGKTVNLKPRFSENPAIHRRK